MLNLFLAALRLLTKCVECVEKVATSGEIFISETRQPTMRRCAGTQSFYFGNAFRFRARPAPHRKGDQCGRRRPAHPVTAMKQDQAIFDSDFLSKVNNRGGIADLRRGFIETILLRPSLAGQNPLKRQHIAGRSNIHIVKRQIQPMDNIEFDTEFMTSAD